MIFRDITKRRIFDILDKSEFGAYAFEVLYPGDLINNKTNTTLEIKFIGNKTFFVKCYEAVSTTTYKSYISFQSCPGRYLQNEGSKELTNFEQIFDEVEQWLKRLIQDLKDQSPLLNKVFDEIHRIEEEFEKKINEKFDATDMSYFSETEVDELKEKLNDLFGKFEKLKESNELKDNELKSIKDEVEKIKKNLNILPKTTWFKSSGKKIINLIGKYLNPETIKSISVEVVKGLLDSK